jgi:hypothetical protein
MVAAVAIPWGSLPTSHWLAFWLPLAATKARAYWVRMSLSTK